MYIYFLLYLSLNCIAKKHAQKSKILYLRPCHMPKILELRVRFFLIQIIKCNHCIPYVLVATEKWVLRISKKTFKYQDFIPYLFLYNPLPLILLLLFCIKATLGKLSNRKLTIRINNNNQPVSHYKYLEKKIQKIYAIPFDCINHLFVFK